MESFTKIADDIYAEHGLTDEALRALTKILRQRIKEVLPMLARVWLHEAMRRHRRRLMRAPVAGLGSDDAGSPETEIVDLLTRRSIGDFPLWNGTRLRDATREQIEQQIQTLSARRDGLTRNIRFLRRVADRLQSGERVADRITEQELVLMVEVEEAA